MRLTWNWRSVVFYVGPLALWAMVVGDFSTRQGSMDHSGVVLRWALNALSPQYAASLSDFQFYCLHYSARKLAHVLEYMALAVLMVRAVRWGRPGLPWIAVAAGILFPAVFASLDEVHQATVPGRSSSVRDVLIDVSGASAGVLATCWLAASAALESRVTRTRAATRDGRDGT